MGAFVAGDEDFIEFLIQKSRPYIYTTAIPSCLCEATLKSLELIQKGEQNEKLFNNINYFKKFASKLELKFSISESAIQPLVIGSSSKALKLSQKLFEDGFFVSAIQLFEDGFFVSAIRPPTVGPNTARLRFTLSADHNFQQIESLLEKVKDVMA